MEFMRADELSFDPRSEMSRIFVEGFYMWLKYFSKNKAKLQKAFEHIFVLPEFYVAVEGDKVVAIAGLNDDRVGGNRAVQFDLKVLRKHLGFVMGGIAHSVLKKQFVDKHYPFELGQDASGVDFVATAPEYRGRGINFDLINYVMRVAGFAEYVLEVIDTNASGRRLYDKLGFVEFMRVETKHKEKYAGFKYHIYMRIKV